MDHCSSSSSTSSSSNQFHYYYGLIPDLTSMEDSRMEQLRSCLPENHVIGKSFNYSSSRFGLGNLSAAGASVYGRSSGNPLFAAFRSVDSFDYSSYFRLRNFTGGRAFVYGCSGNNPLLTAFRSAVCMDDSVPRSSRNRLLATAGLCPDLTSMDCIMMQQLNSYCVLKKNVIGKSSSNFGLRRNLSAAGEFVYGSSGNPLLAALRSTLCIDSVPLHKRTLLQEDMVTGIRWSMVFMRSLEEAVGLTLGAPLNRVKLLLQNQGELIRTGRLSTPYLGIKDCFSRIIKKEGVLSLWKGNSVHLLGTLLREESRISSLAQIEEIAFKSTKDEQQQMQLQKQLDAAASLGLYPWPYPVDFYAYTRLANDIKCGKGNGGRKFSGLLDLYKKTIKSDGIAGIFRGLNVGLLTLLIDHCDVLLEEPIHSHEISEEKQFLVTIVLECTKKDDDDFRRGYEI